MYCQCNVLILHNNSIGQHNVLDIAQLDIVSTTQCHRSCKFRIAHTIINFVIYKMTFSSFYFQWFGFYKTGQAIETYSLFESKIYTEVGYTQLSHTHKIYRNDKSRKNSCTFGHCLSCVGHV